MAEVISLTDLIESRLKKQQEIEYYQETLVRLQEKIAELDKEVGITTIIIEVILTSVFNSPIFCVNRFNVC